MRVNRELPVAYRDTTPEKRLLCVYGKGKPCVLTPPIGPLWLYPAFCRKAVPSVIGFVALFLLHCISARDQHLTTPKAVLVNIT